jgi:Tfp pilus assembly protein PilN
MPMERINLLPPEERRKASRERGLMYALLFLIFVVAVLGVLYVFENQKLSTRNHEVATQQAQLDAINAEVAKLKPFETLQSQRASMTTAASTIVDSRVIWSIIFEEVSLLIPDTVRLTGLTAAVPPNMLSGAAAGTAGSVTTDVTFSGQAASHKDVADFMTRLGLMPQLMNVQLVSAAKAAASSGTGSAATTVSLVGFQITAQLRPFETAPTAAAAPGTTTPASGQ